MDHKYGIHKSFIQWGCAAAVCCFAAASNSPRGRATITGYISGQHDKEPRVPNSPRGVGQIPTLYDIDGSLQGGYGLVEVAPGGTTTLHRCVENESVPTDQAPSIADSDTHEDTRRRETLAMVLPTVRSKTGRKMVGGLVNRNNNYVPWRERWYNYWYPVATNIGQKYKDENVLILGGFDHINPSQIDAICLEEDGKYAHNNRRSRRKPLMIRVATEVQTRMGSRLTRSGPIGKANEKAVRSCALSIMTEWRVPRAKQCDVIDYVIELSFITSMRTLRAEDLAAKELRTNRLRADDTRKHRWNPRWWFSNHYNEDEV